MARVPNWPPQLPVEKYDGELKLSPTNDPPAEPKVNVGDGQAVQLQKLSHTPPPHAEPGGSHDSVPAINPSPQLVKHPLQV